MEDHAAVTSLLEQLTGVIKGYSDQIWVAAKEFRKLKDDVAQLNDILKSRAMANMTSDDDLEIRSINHMMEAVHEVEDTIDSWLTEYMSKSKSRRFLMKSNFAKKLKSLRQDKVKHMLRMAAADMKGSLQSAVGTTKKVQVHERMKYAPLIRREVVVGLKDEKENIIRHLRENQPELDIISIIGKPWLGKTTLAWMIYNDKDICYEFPIRIWVHMHKRIDSRDVLCQIMRTFTSSSIDELYSMSNEELCKKVQACLYGEKFLLVMDDVCKAEQLDELKAALPHGNGQSKVLITSRELTIGRRGKVVHSLRCLNGDESWELLQLEVFGRVGVCPDSLKDIASVIAERCAGIPMTIVVLGGVLRDQYIRLKNSDDAMVRERWMNLSRNLNPNILEVVALSYSRLPDRLRDCFLYLGVFPAGYEIPTWTLTRLWIAEGFIQPDDDENRSLEEISEDNLNDLISRNLLMARKINPMGEAKVCMVHDIIRNFCISKAEKQNMFQEIKMEEEEERTGHVSAAHEMEKIRRLCVHSDVNKFFSEKLKGPRVRSFLCFQMDAIDMQQGNVSALYNNFLLLRILHSQTIKLTKIHPLMLKKLIHLRYIVLCVPDLAVLPEQISQLWNLQTIVVDTNSNSVTSEANLWKMMRLRHVKTKAAIVFEREFIGGGDQAAENLQTLNRLSPQSVPQLFQRARNLKTLGIRGELATLFHDMSLEELASLEKLKLYHDAVAHENPLRHLPDSFRFPPNLKRLTLSNTSLDWKHMSTLANIRGIKVLKLKENAFAGIQWDATSVVFGELECLVIVCSDLVLWEAVPNSFPGLRHLGLNNCENLKEIPDCILQTLENLDIVHVRPSILNSAKRFPNLQLKTNGPDLIAAYQLETELK